MTDLNNREKVQIATALSTLAVICRDYAYHGVLEEVRDQLMLIAELVEVDSDAIGDLLDETVEQYEEI